MIFSNNNTISGNTANNNTINGIVLRDQCNDTKIIGNTANFNIHVGIYIKNSYTTLISTNNCSNNGGTGMDLRSIYDTEIVNNTANDNGVYPSVCSGISVQASRNITIWFNHLQGNGKGMNIYNDQDCKIFNNAAISNEDEGIKIERVINVTVEKNNVSYSEIGIMLRGSSSLPQHTYNNTVSGNVVTDNYYGMYLLYTDNNTILGNTINYNYYGIYVRISNYNNISRNNLIGNVECIFEVDCVGNVLENNYCRNKSEKPIITGYNIFLLIGTISVVSVIIMRKRSNAR